MNKRRGNTWIVLWIVLWIVSCIVLIYFGILETFDVSRDQVREVAVIRNLHTIQIAFEDFSVLSNGRYPVSAVDTTDKGMPFTDLLPGKEFPVSPFAKKVKLHGKEAIENNPPFLWNSDAAQMKGACAATTATTDGYLLKARGSDVSTYIFSLSSETVDIHK